MRIYTKTGDQGETSLYKGGRVPKDSPRLEAYGTLDELNSVLGQALSFMPVSTDWAEPVLVQARRVQKDLFSLGAMLATLGDQPPAWHVVPEDITALETAIDRMEEDLEPMKTFILPGGHPAGATLHVARTIARRAERAIVGVQRDDSIDPLIIQYVNRLSDYLFVLARYVNHHLKTPEPPLVM
ncbi:MAG: cob(I)yrinic acid a,c-diamide adenosyltransferase [Candidatus Sericytochromatia bacterium]